MLKKEKLPYIHRLRIIQLFEADFNAALKIFYSKKMMPHGDKHNFSGEQAQGARKGCTIHDLISNLRYTAINSELARTPTTYCFNDQVGNFDHIRHNLNAVLQCRMGIPKQVTLTTAKTLSHMEHRVRTVHGDSKKCIHPSIEIAGSGQGSGHGTASNHVQSVPMIKSLSRMTKRCSMTDPTGTRKNKQHVVGWIDDVTIKENYPPHITYQQMLSSITLTCLIWRRLIRLTGGDLAAHKCVVYTVYWHFTCMNTIPYCTTTRENPGEVTFQDDDNPTKMIVIPRKNPKKSEHITGLRFNPLSKMKEELTYRQQEMTKLAMRMNRGSFNRPETTMIYNSRWQSRISFYLPLTTFTHSQCERLQAIMYAAMLPQMGYKRHIPRVIRHGPKHLVGSGMIHMYTEQGTKHLQHFLGTIRQGRELSDILQITYSNYQLHLGISIFFLNTSIMKCPHHVQGRIAFLWDFCNQHNITFNCPTIWTPTFSTHNDCNLMDTLTNVRDIAEDSIKTFNACRIYLQVINLSDITTPNGLAIRPEILEPPINYYPRSTLTWPYQKRPTSEAWVIWKTLLIYYFCKETGPYLRYPVGQQLS